MATKKKLTFPLKYTGLKIHNNTRSFAVYSLLEEENIT